MTHVSVLLKEVIEGLEIKPSDVVVDATAGSGGHSKALACLLNKNGTLVGIDMDKKALSIVEKNLSDSKCKVLLKEGNFRNIDKFLNEEGIKSVDKILFDFGISSQQLEHSGRGFSFSKDEPLLMTFKEKPTKNDLTAMQIVNEWDEENIDDIIFGYGGEKFSRRIAKGIIEFRKEKQIESTFELVSIIEKATPKWYHSRKIHFATKTFQALRITVNDEMQSIKEALEKYPKNVICPTLDMGMKPVELFEEKIKMLFKYGIKKFNVIYRHIIDEQDNWIALSKKIYGKNIWCNVVGIPQQYFTKADKFSLITSVFFYGVHTASLQYPRFSKIKKKVIFQKPKVKVIYIFNPSTGYFEKTDTLTEEEARAKSINILIKYSLTIHQKISSKEYYSRFIPTQPHYIKY